MNLAQLVVLPGQDADAAARAQELGCALHCHRRDRVDAALRAAPADRVRHWRDLLSGLGDIQGVNLQDAWYLFAYNPGPIVSDLSLDERPCQRWSMLVDVYTAWLELVADRQIPGVDDRSAAIGAACLARTRWKLLSAPDRPGVDDLPAYEGRLRVHSRVQQARQAREQWLTVLAEIDDYPVLATLDMEAEAADLATVDLGSNAAPPCSAVPDSGDAVPRSAIAGYVVTRLLLPRFDWRTSRTLVLATEGSRSTVHWWCAATVLTAAVVAFGVAIDDRYAWSYHGYTVAAVLALLGYAVIAAGAAISPALGWLWLLRQPAGSAVGLLALGALPADWWWKADPALLGQAVVLLAVVGVGYLLAEASNHGARGWYLLRRTGGITLAGFLHAFLIALIGLRTVVPAFTGAPQGTDLRLSCWWTAAGCTADGLTPWQIVLAATAWSFVVGVFLQILWDDQPITAPLAHVRWVRGTSL
ncbi:hypothetical protein [Actinomadura sp. 7K507]|uniref:hypothetical protein n=1 Tax=Actinomadura sp. 7K507 TaxID=2530365 RepID=UPI001052902D|nr:hypothetical protein [Actinomadura sp. 7K507]TDC84524.1 hypothetical protein E1285_26695 [Actinomadura sp. 7K507]